MHKASLALVRFPNSLGCELGERRVYTRGIELRGPIVKTFFIESGQQGTELISSTQELSFVIEKTHASSLGAAVELLFSLRPICHFPSADLPLLLLAFVQLYFFHNHVSYLFPLSDCMFQPSADLPLALRPICHLPFAPSFMFCFSSSTGFLSCTHFIFVSSVRLHVSAFARFATLLRPIYFLPSPNFAQVK